PDVADADGGLVRPAVPSLVPARVDAVRRQQDPGRHRHVGGRKSDLLAPPVATLDHAPDLVRTPEETVSRLHVASGQRLADGGGRHGPGHARYVHEGEADHLEAVLGAHGPKQLDVAAPVAAEVEILSDDNDA